MVFVVHFLLLLRIRICIKNINRTMDEATSSMEEQSRITTNPDGADKRISRADCTNGGEISIVERIVQKTGNRKLAAILALDLFLVGVDTVI